MVEIPVNRYASIAYNFSLTRMPAKVKSFRNMKDKIIAVSPEYIRIDYAASPNYVIRIGEIKNLKLIELPKLKQGVSPSNRDTNLSLSERSEIWFTEGKTAVRMEMAKG